MFTITRKFVVIAAFLATTTTSFAQVGVGTTTPNADALLEINSTVANPGGVLLPRMALTMTTSPAPLSADVAGMIVYNTATAGDVTPGFYYNDGAVWVRLGAGAASADWTISGNAGTTAGTNFLGTTDAVALHIRTTNSDRIIIQPGGNIGINDIGNATDQLSVTDTDYPVNGYATGSATNHTGLYASQRGIGSTVWGENFKTTNDGTSSIFGEMEASNDPAIEGRNNFQSTNAVNSIGVYGNYNVVTGDKIGIGVSGKAVSIKGSKSYGIGVQGEGGGENFGLYAIGNSGASGTKSFNIDHPLDPDNKTLKHFSIESNEILNLYRGTTVFDSNGNASIKLPEYFNAINKDFSYQLTPVGAAMPNLFIKNKINSTGEFTISGGINNKEVSWVVYGVRNDKYLQVNPNQRKTVIEKPNHYKGRYWDVKSWGKTDEEGILYKIPSKEMSRR